MVLTKGIHNGYGIVKLNSQLCLVIIKTQDQGTKTMKLIRVIRLVEGFGA